MSVRKAHNSGRNHLRNVVDYYQRPAPSSHEPQLQTNLSAEIGHEKAQSVIDSITNSYAAEGQSASNPMLGQNPGVQPMMPPPFGFPGGLPPPPFGMPGLPQGMIPRKSLLLPPLLSERHLIATAPGGRGMPMPPFPPNGPPMPGMPPGGLPFPPPGGLPFPPPNFPQGGLPFPPPAGFPVPPGGFPPMPPPGGFGQQGQDQGGDRR
jgi:U1 small nuclear ribonucleoprotein C